MIKVQAFVLLVALLPLLAICEHVTRCSFVETPCRPDAPFNKDGTCRKYVCNVTENCTASTDPDCSLVNNDSYQLYIVGDGAQQVLKYDNDANDGFIMDMYDNLPHDLSRVDAFALDFQSSRIFVYQAYVGKIYSKFTNQTNWTLVLDRAGLNITCMTYDAYSDNLYIGENMRGELYVVAADGSGRRRTLANFQNPTRLQLYSEANLMFVYGTKNATTQAGAWQFDLAGNNEKSLLISPGYNSIGFGVNIEKGELYAQQYESQIIVKYLFTWNADRLIAYTTSNITSFVVDDTFLYSFDRTGYLYLVNQDAQPYADPTSVIEMPDQFRNHTQLLVKKPCTKNYCSKNACDYLCLFGGFAEWPQNQATATPTIRCYLDDGKFHCPLKPVPPPHPTPANPIPAEHDNEISLELYEGN